MNVNINEIPEAVERDPILAKAIADAIYDELRLQNSRKTSGKLKVGDIITFNGDISPKYMIGQKARVVKLNRARAKVKMIQPVGRFSGIINCPYSLFEVKS